MREFYIQKAPSRVTFFFFFLVLLIACSNPSSEDTGPVSSSEIKNIESRIILVSGVTGRQGGAVARALIENGFKVRGLTRNPESERAKVMSSLGIEMVRGDFKDTTTVDAALLGVDGAFLVTSFWEHGYEQEVIQGKNFIDAAKKAKLSHLVFSSVANSDQSTGIPHFESKYEIENYLKGVNLGYTILRPVSFMENWEYSREKILAGKIVSPFSESTRLQQISVRDIGRFAALAFSKPDDWKGRTIDIAGDQYSMGQAVDLFSNITGSPVEFIQISWAEYEEAEGEEMTIMDRWISSVGYSANLNMVRRELPDMLTLEEYLYQADW